MNLLDGVRVRRARIPSGGLPQFDAVLLGALGLGLGLEVVRVRVRVRVRGGALSSKP